MKYSRYIGLGILVIILVLVGCSMQPIDRAVVSSRLMRFDERDFNRDLTRAEISGSGLYLQIDTSIPSLPSCPT